MSQPKVVFYEIPDRDPDMLVRVACKLTCEYYRQNTSVHIIVENENWLRSLSTTLWNYPRNSFIPHRRAAEPQSDCLVTMHSGSKYDGAGTVLVNLVPNVPECIEQFGTVCEFVTQKEDNKKQARERFVQYRDRYGKPRFKQLDNWDSDPILD